MKIKELIEKNINKLEKILMKKRIDQINIYNNDIIFSVKKDKKDELNIYLFKGISELTIINESFNSTIKFSDIKLIDIKENTLLIYL